MVILFVCTVRLTLTEMRESLCVLVYGEMCVLELLCCFWWNEECEFPFFESSQGKIHAKKCKKKIRGAEKIEGEIHEGWRIKKLHICFYFPATIPKTK